MRKTLGQCLAIALFVSTVWVGAARAQEESALKNRPAAPKASDVDPSVSIDSLLAKQGKDNWSSKRAATLDGYVRQVEKDDDGDLVIFLAGKPDETDSRRWVIIEVPSGWQKKHQELKEKSLRGLLLEHVKVTGWLYYDSDAGEEPSRGTPWEVHPVTSISRVE